MGATLTRGEILELLHEVKDPEIPALSVVELGVVRDAQVSDEGVVVTITPTYSGCPAMRLMEEEILAALARHGLRDARVETSFREVWTTDWMTDEARAKLRASGIAPPLPTTREGEALVPLRRHVAIACPFCGSHRTVLRSEFGSTACKALYTCSECGMPFDYFKGI